MTNFEFTSPDGKRYSVQGPYGATPEQAFQILQSQIGGGASAPAPVSVNDVGRAFATGVPIVGGALDKLDAATNAALAPLLNRFFKPDDQLSELSFSDRYAHSLRDQEGADTRFAKDHPGVDTAAQVAGSLASTAPFMMAAPKAFGLTGTVPQMVRNGAISGAALSAADAASRGQNPVDAALTGGVIGGAAGPVGKVIGKGVAAIADRVRPPAAVPQAVENVAGVDVPLSQAEATQNPALSAEQQIMLRGGRGDAAQANAQGFKDLQDARMNQARGNIAAGLDPTGSAATTSPQDAAERIAAELISQEQARQAAGAGVHAGLMSPAQQGTDMARAFGGGQVRAATPFDAAETLSDRLAAARDAAKTDYRGKYDRVAEQPGEFAPGSAAGFRGDVDAGLANAQHPVSLDPTNTPLALHALDVIDSRMNAAGPGRPVAGAPAAALGVDHAQTVADIRQRFGNDVASAYDRQKQAATAPAAAAPKAQSLLEFIASKGGLGPDAELDAIGAHGHTVNVEGVGRRKLVRQGGWPLDYAREAAEEAGYFRGDHNGTSGVNDLLDAVDAEMRGQKRYPEGSEGYQTKREGAARSEREQAEYDRHMQGFEDDLHEAGHGDLGPDVKARAVHLMANERMDPDSAVEHAMHQLDQEDAAGGAAPKGDFPGDLPAPVRGSEPAKPGSAFTMRDVEQVRKQLSTLYGDARRRMMAGGSGADLHALEHIMDQFGSRVDRMVSEGKFSGDGPAVLQMQKDARASFADYKSKFAKRGSGDTIGAAVEKILGKFSDTKATPDEVVRLAYGSGSSPGGQMPVQVAQRIIKIFGKNSAEFGTYKQGLFAHLRAGEPEQSAGRIEEFLTGTKGRLLAQTAFEPSERATLARYADRLRGTLPQAKEPGAVAAAVRRYTGADGAAPASANQIVSDLYGATGKGAGRIAVPLAAHLKETLSPESWNALRQGMFEKLTNAGEGKIPFESQALSQRLHEFLNESGSQLAKTLYTPRELELMSNLASVYKQMIPVKGTTNPSGTAPMLARMAGGLRHTLLPLLGLHGGGIPGAVAGYALDKGVTAIGNANAARKATSLFYGPQARRAADPRFA
ncbi:MAG: hypothetical protein P4M15_04970, partial [Alphaproteobacteria bacterium]|nr:hypothetical protein [Alphaproteobacteria bacterium]